MVSENDTLPKLQINVIHVLRQRMLALRSQDVNNDLRFLEVWFSTIVRSKAPITKEQNKHVKGG